MVRVVVAEDEPPLAVRDVPVRHLNAFLTRDLPDDPPRDGDAVREHGGLKSDGSYQVARRKGCQQRSLEISAEYRFRQRLAVECAGREKPERTGVCVFADLEAVVGEVLDVIER